MKNRLGTDPLNTNLWIYPNHVTTGEVVETIVNTSGEQWADEDGTLENLYSCDTLVTDLLYNMFAWIFSSKGRHRLRYSVGTPPLVSNYCRTNLHRWNKK